MSGKEQSTAFTFFRGVNVQRPLIWGRRRSGADWVLLTEVVVGKP